MALNFFKIRKGFTLEPMGGADPVGTNGDVYYNSTLNKFRKFENGAWSDLSTGGGGSGNAGWVSAELPILAGSSSIAVSFSSSQPDTSYIVLAQLINDVDPTPQYQQVLTIVKSPGGFTASWNAPTDSANYRLAYIVPLKAFPMREVAVGNGATSFAETFLIPQNGANYGLMAQLQNISDPSPQFQTVMITNKTGTGFTASWDDLTDSGNYVLTYLVNATAQFPIGNGATSVTAPLPVNYGNTNYAVIAMMHNTTDPTPQYQPMIVTLKTNNTFTASWNDPTDSANYVVVYYAISFS